jgi:hypothetical protein
VVDLASGRQLCRTESCTQTKCQSACAAGEYPVAVTDFLANGGDGMEVLKDKPRAISKVLVRDILIAFVREHDPITAALLGSVKAGGPQRIRQQGQDTLEHE